MKPVAIVTPWFGRDLVGGAELEAWQIAARLAKRGYNIEVLTTCCRSHADDWAINHFAPGFYEETEGFAVRRFAVEPRDRVRFDRVNGHMLAIDRRTLRPGVSPVSAADEDIFLHNLI